MFLGSRVWPVRKTDSSNAICENFKFSTPRFGLCGHNQALKLLWCIKCCAHFLHGPMYVPACPSGMGFCLCLTETAVVQLYCHCSCGLILFCLFLSLGNVAFLLEIEMSREHGFCLEIEMPVISQYLWRHDLHVNVYFETLVGMTIENPFFFDLMAESQVGVRQHFGGMYCLHLQGQRLI
jgi:hypothetical protein